MLDIQIYSHSLLYLSELRTYIFKIKINKNRLRSAMKKDLLESLMLISIETDIIPEIDIIIDVIGRTYVLEHLTIY
jgi:hypothetical protein